MIHFEVITNESIKKKTNIGQTSLVKCSWYLVLNTYHLWFRV